MQSILQNTLLEPLVVGDVALRNRSFLAPMSGVTDLPFRKLCWQMGAGMVVTEMVACEAFLEENPEMQKKAALNDLPVNMVQLVGCEARWMALAAKRVQDQGASVIDINMGCPARRVVNGYSGSALMRDLDHAVGLVDAVIGAVEVPVTLKMRLGWDHQSINAAELARRAQAAGVQMVTVHGRTRCQFYKGSADWPAVEAVREAISIPLVVNGDIIDRQRAAAAIKQSGADAVMIGRGAYGAPWLPGYIAGSLSSKDVAGIIRDKEWLQVFYEDILGHYGTEYGVKQARKHLGWTIDRLDLAADMMAHRKRMMTSFSPREVLELIELIYDASLPINVPDMLAA